jgi:catechol 2,3-dioxygenase-like lactoylglutathione lyase family enzyme
MRIHQLTLASLDLAAQSAFWGTVLSLPVQQCDDRALEVRLQSSTIRFEQVPPGTDPRYHFAINIPAHSIVDAAAWITGRHQLLAFLGDSDEEEGATVVDTDRGASALYFLDAGGNVVELISSPYLDTGAERPFGAGSLLEVAEIGIATANVHATQSAVQETFQAGVLWGGREGSLLTAIGDDHGVVIVAPIGRGWIPVGLPARPLPTTVVAAGPRARETTLDEGPYEFRSIAGTSRPAPASAPAWRPTSRGG